MLAALQAAAPYPAHLVLRIPQGDTALIKQVLEIGATTLLVPMVESAAQARELVRATRYSPQGVRGMGSGLARSSRWSAHPHDLHEANDNVSLLVQVETAAALALLDEIAAVEGVHGVFIGPAGLSASVGHLGKPGHPDVQQAIDGAMVRILAAGKAPGILAVGVEATFLARAARALAARFKPNDQAAPQGRLG